MSRPIAAVLVVAAASVLPPSAIRAAESPTAEQARRAAEVRKKLTAPFNFSGFDDPETKLQDVLEYITRATDVACEVNEKAFRDEQSDPDVNENVNDKTIGRPLRQRTNDSLETMLRRVLARIPSASGATFVIRGGVVEITTRRAASPASWKQAPEVSLEFDKRPLQEALQEIADATGVNLVLDARTEKGQMPVSATMRGVGVDTAVQLLANMADLSVLPVENVLYVTTRENAKALRAEILKLQPEGKDKASLPSGRRADEP